MDKKAFRENVEKQLATTAGQINFSDIYIGNENLVELSQMNPEQFSHLSLENTGVTDSGMNLFPKFTQLKHLDISNNDIRGDSLSCLSNMTSLEYLHLEGLKIVNHDLKHLQGLCHLVLLDLDSTEVDDDAIEYLQGMRFSKFI